jgi:hypothetical protein
MQPILVSFVCLVGRKNDLCCLGCLLFEIHGGSKSSWVATNLAYNSTEDVSATKATGAVPQMKQLPANE